MFVLRVNINRDKTEYYFNNIKNARLFERKILVIVYNDIDGNQSDDIYYFTENARLFENTIVDFDYNCDNDKLKRFISNHRNIMDIEIYVEEIHTLD